MLSYKELITHETISDYEETIPINASAECKPILVVNKNNYIVYSNQSAQIAFGLINIHLVSMMPRLKK